MSMSSFKRNQICLWTHNEAALEVKVLRMNMKTVRIESNRGIATVPLAQLKRIRTLKKKKTPSSYSAMPQVGEICKVRKEAVGDETKGYTYAVVKRLNKTTVQINVLTNFKDSDRKYTVKMNDIWRLKGSQRKAALNKWRINKKTDLDETSTVANTVGNLLPVLPDGSLWPFLFREVDETTFVSDGLSCVANLRISNSNTLITIANDSVVKCTSGAIVNAANEGCLGGGGVDGEIGHRGGPTLYDARLALPILNNGSSPYGPRCHTGDAKITIAGDLPAEFVIHAVGPNFRMYETEEVAMNLLVDAYKAALARGAENSIKTIAFCILSAGIFRGYVSLRTIIKTGIETIANNTYPGLERVYFCAFMPEERRVTREICYDYQAEFDAATRYNA